MLYLRDARPLSGPVLDVSSIDTRWSRPEDSWEVPKFLFLFFFFESWTCVDSRTRLQTFWTWQGKKVTFKGTGCFLQEK